MEKKVVTVFGATGTLGFKIVRELIAHGAHVRAAVRTTSNRANLENIGVTDFVIADMMDTISLNIALTKLPKASAVVSSAAGYTGHTKGDSPKTDREGYTNLADASKAAGIPRFVLISILECDKAVKVPHFYNKYITEKYLKEIGQPFIALRAGAFLDQARDFVLPKLKQGVFPTMFSGVALGMIYSPDLARYAAIAALSLPQSAVNGAVDVGWSHPVTGDEMAKAFSGVLGKRVEAKPAFPPFVVNFILPIVGLFKPGVKDMHAMIKWIKKGQYTSKNTSLQKELFSDLPTAEEAVRRYCFDRKLA